eukprot:TRINITY_DN3801_c0_g1_i6.p1 TRINITY_DN3801_c0_g1~~TRINITY_DN3801_c0_g1_i6.p1  ORF type:complete len:119 (+),score=5.20 TRINITY_DN3801_c0_g1_i6:223-579(+)
MKTVLSDDSLLFKVFIISFSYFDIFRIYSFSKLVIGLEEPGIFLIGLPSDSLISVELSVDVVGTAEQTKFYNNHAFAQTHQATGGAAAGGLSSQRPPSAIVRHFEFFGFGLVHCLYKL